jgi:geranylgeranyl reductase family protein
MLLGMVPGVDFDLCVVGAGPAGSSAAAAALARGLSVLQVDAAAFPRVKPCAGGLTTRAVRALPLELGPLARGEHREFEFNAWGARGVRYSCSAPLLTMVDRPALDQRMVEANRASPRLAFHGGTRVRVLAFVDGRFELRTEHALFRAAQLVGADGANGLVRRTFPRSRPRGRAVAVEINLPAEALAAQPVVDPCFDFGVLPRGYGWVFPKDGLVSVGLYSLADGLSGLRERLLAYLAAKGLRCRVDPLACFEAHTIPLGGHDLVADDVPVYLAGDAAGLADALTGEGIYHALASGRVAGELAADVAAGRASPREYRARLEEPVLGDTRWSWRLAGPFYRQPALALRLLDASGLWRPLVHGTGSGVGLKRSLVRALAFGWSSLRTRSVARAGVP